MDKVAEKRKKCPRCDKCPTVSNFQKHLQTHADTTKLSCEICNKLFKNKRTLEAHLVRHKTEVQFICKVCNLKLPDQSTLSRHKRFSESSEGFKCSKCCKRFKQKGRLLVHEKKLHIFGKAESTVMDPAPREDDIEGGEGSPDVMETSSDSLLPTDRTDVTPAKGDKEELDTTARSTPRTRKGSHYSGLFISSSAEAIKKSKVKRAVDTVEPPHKKIKTTKRRLENKSDTPASENGNVMMTPVSSPASPSSSGTTMRMLGTLPIEEESSSSHQSPSINPDSTTSISQRSSFNPQEQDEPTNENVTINTVKSCESESVCEEDHAKKDSDNGTDISAHADNDEDANLTNEENGNVASGVEDAVSDGDDDDGVVQIDPPPSPPPSAIEIPEQPSFTNGEPADKEKDSEETVVEGNSKTKEVTTHDGSTNSMLIVANLPNPISTPTSIEKDVSFALKIWRLHALFPRSYQPVIENFPNIFTVPSYKMDGDILKRLLDFQTILGLHFYGIKVVEFMSRASSKQALELYNFYDGKDLDSSLKCLITKLTGLCLQKNRFLISKEASSLASIPSILKPYVAKTAELIPEDYAVDDDTIYETMNCLDRLVQRKPPMDFEEAEPYGFSERMATYKILNFSIMHGFPSGGPSAFAHLLHHAQQCRFATVEYFQLKIGNNNVPIHLHEDWVGFRPQTPSPIIEGTMEEADVILKSLYPLHRYDPLDEVITLQTFKMAKAIGIIKPWSLIFRDFKLPPLIKKFGREEIFRIAIHERDDCVLELMTDYHDSMIKARANDRLNILCRLDAEDVVWWVRSFGDDFKEGMIYEMLVGWACDKANTKLENPLLDFDHKVAEKFQEVFPAIRMERFTLNELAKLRLHGLIPSHHIINSKQWKRMKKQQRDE